MQKREHFNVRKTTYAGGMVDLSVSFLQIMSDSVLGVFYMTKTISRPLEHTQQCQTQMLMMEYSRL